MTHSLTPSPSAAPMVVQYGFRDEDDESASEDDRQKRRIFSPKGLLQRTPSIKRTGGKLGGFLGGDGKNLLTVVGGGNKSNHNNNQNTNGLYSGHNSDDEQQGNDSDDGSVCSRASVAERASKTFKKLGGKLRLGRKKNEDEEYSSSSEGEDDDEEESGSETTEDEDDTDDDSDDDRSVASAFKRVTGKLGKALRVGRRRDSDSDDESDSDEEDEALQPEQPKPRTRLPGLRRLSRDNQNMANNNSDDNDNTSPLQGVKSDHRRRFTVSSGTAKKNTFRRSQSAGAEEMKARLFRRSTTDETQLRRGPSDVAPSSQHNNRPRRHTSDFMPESQRIAARLKEQEEEQRRNARHSRRQQENQHFNPGPAACAAAPPAAADLGYGDAAADDLGYGEQPPTGGGGSGAKRRGSVTKYNLEEQKAEEEGRMSDLSNDSEDDRHRAAFNPQAQYGSAAPARACDGDMLDWSMNVTEEMLEEVTSDAEDDNSGSRHKGFKMNVPKNMLVDLPKSKIRA